MVLKARDNGTSRLGSGTVNINKWKFFTRNVVVQVDRAWE